MSTISPRAMFVCGLALVIFSASSTCSLAQTGGTQQLQQIINTLAALQSSVNALTTAEGTDSTALVALQSPSMS